MLTLRTQKAIALMHDLAQREVDSVHTQYHATTEEVEKLLTCLEKKGLITHVQEEEEEDGTEHTPSCYGYRLARPFHQISLLDILEALDEQLKSIQHLTEDFYSHHNRAAQKLGVINYMTRFYLEKIKLTEL